MTIARRSQRAAFRTARAETADQHLAPRRKSGVPFEIEFDGGKGIANRARQAPGGEGGAGCGEAGERLAYRQRPHFRIAGRREAVEKKGIHRCVNFAQLTCRVAEDERQDDAAVVEVQPVGARRQRRPLVDQGVAERGEVRPVPMGESKVGCGERVFFERNEVQPTAAARVAPPGLPGGEEIQAEAKAGFENDEALPVLPTLRQAIATEKDVPRLRRTAMGRVVNVFEDSRKGGASRCEFEASGLQGHGRHSNPARCARLA